MPDNLKEIKNRVIKQPFRMGFEAYFMKDKKENIFESIKNSNIISSLMRENEVNKLFFDYSSSNSKSIAHRILRLYSVSVFEKIYGSSIK